MDMSRYRDSGELSDVTIIVDDKEFHLHKFPLYIHSEFFKAKSGGQQEAKNNRIELEQFPGGTETFQTVADFCYSKPAPVTSDNACVLRCAAEFLQMTSGSTNLASVTDRQINDVLSAAKVTRDVQAIANYLLPCVPLADIAERSGIVERCSSAIVDCWLISSCLVPRRSAISGSTFMGRSSCHNRPMSDTDARNLLKVLSALPFDWFLKMFISARDKNVRPEILSALVQGYITTIMKQEHTDKESTKKTEDKNVDKTEEEDNEKADAQEKNNDDSDNDGNDGSKPAGDGGSVSENSKDAIPPVNVSDSEIIEKADAESIGHVLDALLKEIPPALSLADTLSVDWILRMLRSSDRLTTESRALVLKLASNVVHKFPTDELASLSVDTMKDLITCMEGATTAGSDDSDNSCSEGEEHRHTGDEEIVCDVVDRYLLERASSDQLEPDTVFELSGLIRNSDKRSHDMLYDVIERMMKSDKIPVTDEQKQSLLDLVDCSCLSECTLQRAYTSELVPQTHVTKAALELCGRLRHELDDAKQVIRYQEAELDKYGLGAKYRTAGMTSLDYSSYSSTSHTLPDTSYSEWCDTIGPSTSPYTSAYGTRSTSYTSSLPLHTPPVSRKYGANRNRRNFRFS